MTALEEYLIGEPEVDDVDEVPAPENLEQADWQLRKLARLRRLILDNEKIAAIEINHIKRWRDEENGKLERSASFYERNLALFHAALLEQDDKRTSVSLPAGALKSRANPPRVEVVETDAFVAWALAERPTLLKTEHKPVKAEIKRFLAMDGDAVIDPTSGEPVPGLEVVPCGRSFWVDLTQEEEVALAGEEAIQ